MKKLDLVLAWALVVLGFVHCGGSFVLFARLSRESVWFFAGGVALVDTGFLNIQRNGNSKGLARISAVIGNVLMLLVALAITVVQLGTGHLLASPQVLLVLALIIAETFFSIA